MIEAAVALLLAPSCALALASRLKALVSEAAVASLLALSGALVLALQGRRGLAL